MTKYECRERTRESWQAMRQNFRREWNDGFDVALEHYGLPTAYNINEWYYLHACRQADERWPEHRRETVLEEPRSFPGFFIGEKIF